MTSFNHLPSKNTKAFTVKAKRNLADQALRYLASLNQPLPDESDKAFYEQNRTDYEALLLLNQSGLGATKEELQAMVDAPLVDGEIKHIVKRLIKIDELIAAEYEKEEKANMTPAYWDGFYSGYTPSPTNRCKQVLDGIKRRTNKLSDEQSDLFLSITRSQAIEFGYCTDGMEDEDFKQSAA